MPRIRPILRKSHDTNVHLRIATSQSLSSRFDKSAAIQRHKGEALERIRGEQHHRDEERRHGARYGGDEGEIDAMPPARHHLHEHREEAQDRRPEEQAALLSRVERGPEVERREIATGVGRDVFETEVVAEDPDLERDDRNRQRAEQRECGVARTLLQIRAILRPADKSRDRSPQADQEGDPEGEMTEQRHYALGTASYRDPHFASTLVA